MSSIAPPGFGSDDAEDDPSPPNAAERQRLKQARRAARRGPDAEETAYDRSQAKGILGERLVGADLARLLTGTDGVLQHSIQFRGLGDIDHLVIGPGGVTVVDAKFWSGITDIRDGLPRCAGYRLPKELAKLEEQRAGARLALLNADPYLRGTDIQVVMCLAREPDRPAEPLLGAGLYLSGSTAAAAIALRPGPLTTRDIEELRVTLVKYLPKVQPSEIDELLSRPARVRRRDRSATPLVPTPPRPRHAPSHQSPTSDPMPTPHPAAAPHPAPVPVMSTRHAPIRQAPLPPAPQAQSQQPNLALLKAVGVMAFLLTGLAAVVIGFFSFGFHPATPSPVVSQLHARRAGHRVIVRFVAPAGRTVRIIVSARHHRQRVDTIATGTLQSFRGSAVPRTTPRFSIRACVIGAAGRCSGDATARTTVRTHRRRR